MGYAVFRPYEILSKEYHYVYYDFVTVLHLAKIKKYVMAVYGFLRP